MLRMSLAGEIARNYSTQCGWLQMPPVFPGYGPVANYDNAPPNWLVTFVIRACDVRHYTVDALFVTIFTQQKFG